MKLNDWLYVFEITVVILLAVAGWLISRNKANREDIDEMTSRLTRVEAELKHMPASTKEIRYIHERIDEVAKTASKIEGEVGQMKHTLGLIQQHLMGGKE